MVAKAWLSPEVRGLERGLSFIRALIFPHWSGTHAALHIDRTDHDSTRLCAIGRSNYTILLEQIDQTSCASIADYYEYTTLAFEPFSRQEREKDARAAIFRNRMIGGFAGSCWGEPLAARV